MGTACLIRSLQMSSIFDICFWLSLGVSSCIKQILLSPIDRFLQSTTKLHVHLCYGQIHTAQYQVFSMDLTLATCLDPTQEKVSPKDTHWLLSTYVLDVTRSPFFIEGWGTRLSGLKLLFYHDVVFIPNSLSATAVMRCCPECCCMWSNRRTQSSWMSTLAPCSRGPSARCTAFAPWRMTLLTAIPFTVP